MPKRSPWAAKLMKRALIFVHKWLGVVLALFFLMWFASGMVLHYVPFPNLSQVDRLEGLEPLRVEPGCCLTAEAIAQRAGIGLGAARLGMHADVPVWRILAGEAEGRAPVWRTFDAESGAPVAPLTAQQAALVAQAFSGRKAVDTEELERDQWTVPQGLDPYRPLVKVRLAGDDGLELYVSRGSAEVVRDTRRAERFWNWIGAVPHWIYPTVLRQFPQAWNQVVVWLSIPGVVLAATGLALGIWQIFLNRTRWIPYRKFWMRWHHIAGLVAAVFTLTWMFSGLMSMNPYGVFGPRSALPSEQARWFGAPSVAQLQPRDALAAHARSSPNADALELERVQFAGHTWYRVHTRVGQSVMRADAAAPAPVLHARFPEEEIARALGGIRGAGHVPVELRRIDAYDSAYYAQNAASSDVRDTRPLPVWRARWADGIDLYADPLSARVLLRIAPSGRWQRVLYQGMHSLDFEALRNRPLVRDGVVMMLSLLGLALCITSCVIGWRIFASKVRPRRMPKLDEPWSPSS